MINKRFTVYVKNNSFIWCGYLLSENGDYLHPLDDCGSPVPDDQRIYLQKEDPLGVHTEFLGRDIMYSECGNCIVEFT